MIYTFFFFLFPSKTVLATDYAPGTISRNQSHKYSTKLLPSSQGGKSIFVPPPCVPLARLYQGVILDSQRALAFLQSISTLFVFCSKMLGPILKQILSSKTFNLVRQNRSSVAIPGSSALKIWLLSNFKRLQPVKMPNLHW